MDTRLYPIVGWWIINPLNIHIEIFKSVSIDVQFEIDEMSMPGIGRIHQNPEQQQQLR